MSFASGLALRRHALRGYWVSMSGPGKGHRYGTILCDLEQGRVIDLLPTRDSATVSTWLRQYPTVQIVSRDRAGAFADASGRARAVAFVCSRDGAPTLWGPKPWSVTSLADADTPYEIPKSPQDGSGLLTVPNRDTLKGKRDYAMLAVPAARVGRVRTVAVPV